MKVRQEVYLLYFGHYVYSGTYYTNKQRTEKIAKKHGAKCVSATLIFDKPRKEKGK